MPQAIEFIIDFGSPNAYLAYKTLPKMIGDRDINLVFKPALLGGIFKLTNNQPPMIAFGGVKGKLAYDMLEMQRFIRKHALTDFKMNPHFPVNTLMLMRGAFTPQAQERLGAYIAAGMKAMWEDGLKMDDPEIFASVMTENGFHAEEMLQSVQDPAIKSALMDATSHAVERGVFGIPAFFIGGEMFFGKDRLEQLMEDADRQRATL
jgi:2-hydroxychromene-2-carboxylate isomerase